MDDPDHEHDDICFVHLVIFVGDRWEATRQIRGNLSDFGGIALPLFDNSLFDLGVVGNHLKYFQNIRGPP